MPNIMHTQIEIARTPEQVRKVFLDFAAYPSWTQGFIRTITPATPGALSPGDKVKCVLQGMTISPTIQENSPEQFRWSGMLWGVPGFFTGEHFFRFEPSKTTPGETTFVHGERFSGVLSFIIADGTSFAKSTKTGFEGFNADIKARAESLA